MRKYDVKNKRNIGIILIISAITIIMFSLVINLFLKTDRKIYEVSKDTIIFDKDKQKIVLEENATIKMKWNREYYLKYKKENISLGTSALSYNETSGELKLYGRYYEITSDEEINITSDETTIKSTALTKFYKLEDRKYLVVDREIKSADGLLTTSDFLIIDIDKVGNATLTNHKVSLKTFSETTIVTSNYTFDIANEILTYGSDKIDLKKIIGSSNTYKKEDLIPEKNTGGASGSDNATSTVNNKDSGNGNNTDSKIGKDNSANKTVIEEVKKATKKTSVIAVTSEVDKINVDYVIYDPKKEFTSVYMEINEEGKSNVETIYLSSSATSYEISKNIFPNTTYELIFKYTYLDDNNELHTETFDKERITTKKPNINLKVTKVSGNNIDYLITNDNTYDITSAKLEVKVNGIEVSDSTVTINGNTVSRVVLESIEEGALVELKLYDVSSSGKIIKDLTSTYKFKY